MGFVARCDTEVGDALLSFTLASPQSEVFVSLEITFDAAALALWTTGGGYSGDFAQIVSSGGSCAGILLEDDSGAKWVEDIVGGSTTPTPTADTPMLVELHYENSVVREAWVDTVQIATGVPDGGLGDAEFVQVGQLSAPNDPAGIVLVDNVKVGTSRGGTDLFQDDFDDGTFDAWTFTDGDVTPLGSSDLTRRVVLGMRHAIVKRRTSVFFDNVKAGSTLGGSDYIDNDFESGF